MPGDAANARDPRFPNLAPEVVRGYLDAPPTVVAEVIAGALSLLPRPRLLHARAATRLGSELGGPFDRGRGGPGGWILLDEPELHLGSGPDIVIPDLAGWRRERVPEGFIDGMFATVAPDWVCEVLSPSTEAFDRAEKLDVYRREGVRHAWLLSPSARTLEVFRRADIGWSLIAVHRGDAVVRAEPFDAAPLELAALWER